MPYQGVLLQLFVRADNFLDAIRLHLNHKGIFQTTAFIADSFDFFYYLDYIGLRASAVEIHVQMV
jgi:hypothetical protein